MPFKFEVQGFDELQRKLQELGEKGQQIAAKGLYEGAGVMADKVSRSVRGIDTAPFRYEKDGTQRKPSPEEKAILLAARTVRTQTLRWNCTKTPILLRKGTCHFRRGLFCAERSCGVQGMKS